MMMMFGIHTHNNPSNTTTTTNKQQQQQQQRLLLQTWITRTLIGLLFLPCVLNILWLGSHVDNIDPSTNAAWLHRHIRSSSSSSTSTNAAAATTASRTRSTTLTKTILIDDEVIHDIQDKSRSSGDGWDDQFVFEPGEEPDTLKDSVHENKQESSTNEPNAKDVESSTSSSAEHDNDQETKGDDTDQESTEGDNASPRLLATEPVSEARRKELLVGKERIAALLDASGVDVHALDETALQTLPTWQHIQSLYYRHNDTPIVVGLETCETFRHSVPHDEAFVGISGMFNTGTNAMDWTLQHNLLDHKTRWQVPWGKHRLASVKWNHTANDHMGLWNKTNTLPVVVIKDPYTWLQSMCNAPYEAKWRHRPQHCPNLVPNDFDHALSPLSSNLSSVPVKIVFDANSTYYWDSLIDVWNDWYRQYYDVKVVDYPRLMVRFEDLLFAPDALLSIIADCIGSRIAQPMVHQTHSSKSHGSGTDLVHAFTKFGSNNDKFRWNNMTVPDLQFAMSHLDPELMRVFDYQTVDVVVDAAAANKNSNNNDRAVPS